MNTPSHKPFTLPIVIIAGGQSQRLQVRGYNQKWQLPFGNDTLLQHMLNLASHVSNTVLINASDAHANSFTHYKYPIINDDDSQGPLSGILCALRWGTKNRHTAIMTIPCDTPFLSAQWLNHLHHQFNLCKRSAVISRSKEGVHPLCGIWSTQLTSDLVTFMQNNEKKAVYRWASQHAQHIDYEQHDPDETEAIDPFMNINTLEDYKNALRAKTVIKK